MIKLRKVKVLTLSLLMAISAMQTYANGTDGFFTGNFDDYRGRDNDSSVTIGGMQNETVTAPLGNGLLVFVAAGMAYVLIRRKKKTLLAALVLLFGLTQCKKNIETVAPSSSGPVFMSLNASYGSDKTVFVPGDDGSGFTWSTTSPEYVYIGGSESGYLGELRAEPQSGDVSTMVPIVFSGMLNAAPIDGEIINVFYLGNGQHTVNTDVDGIVIIDFSDQSATGTTSLVTNFLIAEANAKKFEVVGNTYQAIADLEVKTAVAYFKLEGFINTSGDNETIYAHGSDLFTSAKINFKTGSVAGDYKGTINVGTDGEKYVSLIPSTSSETTLKFDSGSKTGQVQFPNGIIEKKFYSAGVSQNTVDPIPVAANSTPTDALPGLFSVAPGKMVRFSKGNLKCTTRATPDVNGHYDWSSAGFDWDFMYPQYTIAETNGNVGVDYANSNVVSLFLWGTTGNEDLTYSGKYPYSTSIYLDYGPESGDLSVSDGTDWGWCMGGTSSPWRTLEYSEWRWLIGLYNPTPGTNCRAASTVNNVPNARYSRAKIGSSYGMIIFPDNYVHPDNVTSLNYINYTGSSGAKFTNVPINDIDPDTEWPLLEAAGVVFLPAAGNRWFDYNDPDYNIDETETVYDYGEYWSKTQTSGVGSFHCGGEHVNTEFGQKITCSVRLVTDAQ